VSGLIANITKPIIIYRVILDKPVKEYFFDSLKYVFVMIVIFGFLSVIKNLVMPQTTITAFVIMFVIICAVFNGTFLLLFGRTEEFKYLLGIVRGRIKRK